jgi:hypothetical protein
MAGMLQGMGGSLSEEDLKKFGPIIASQGPMPTPSLDGNLIQAGSTGNAAAPLAGYLNKTSTGNPVISYVPPHLRPEDDAPEDGEGSPNDGITDGEDPIDSDGDGIPDTILPPGGFYDVGGGGDNPDGMGGQVGDVSYYGGGYNSFTDMIDGGGPGMFGGQHQGMFSNVGNAISGVLGQDNIANTGNISYAYNPASNNSVNTAPHPGIQYTAPAAAVLGLADQTVDNWSAGQEDGGDASSGGSPSSDGSGQAGDVNNDPNSMSMGGPVEYYAKGSMCPKCGKSNCGCGYNQGGPVQYKKYGGSIWDTENQLRIQQPALDQKRRQAPMAQKSSGGLLGTIMGIGKMASVLTGNPLMAMFGEGGSVKNTPVLGPLSSRQMKMESHMKNEARKDMKFAIDEKRKQELHMNKLRS